jgi:hypothetical protein
MEMVYLGVVLAPLIGAVIAGVFGKTIGRVNAHRVTITGVGIAFSLAFIAFWHIVVNGAPPFNGTLYTWLSSAGLDLPIGFLIDQLSVTMMVVVTFVSWMIHIYTIGYMHNDPGYQRFFSRLRVHKTGATPCGSGTLGNVSLIPPSEESELSEWLWPRCTCHDHDDDYSGEGNSLHDPLKKSVAPFTLWPCGSATRAYVRRRITSKRCQPTS